MARNDSAGKGSPKIAKTSAEQDDERRAAKVRRRTTSKGFVKGETLIEGIIADRRERKNADRIERENFMRQRFFANEWARIQEAGKRYKWTETDMLEAKSLLGELVYGEAAEYGPRFTVYNEVTKRFAAGVFFSRKWVPFMYGQSFSGFAADYAAAVERFGNRSARVLQPA